VRPERILTEEETVKVLALLSDPNLLVLETAIATGARISEILGLKWCHVDLQTGILRIAQRYWRGDIDDPKSKTSKRPLTLGYLGDRYRAKAAADNAKADSWVFVRTDGSRTPSDAPTSRGGRRWVGRALRRRRSPATARSG
jgi:integrase